MKVVTTSQRQFQPFDGAPGMEVCVVSEHGDGGMSLFVKLQPGAKVPRHSHLGREESLIVQGRVDVGGHVATAGDYVNMATGEQHEVRAEEETIFFVVVNQGYTVVA
jgi:quercetin dioxygenase-like cupin family protein